MKLNKERDINKNIKTRFPFTRGRPRQNVEKLEPEDDKYTDKRTNMTGRITTPHSQLQHIIIP